MLTTLSNVYRVREWDGPRMCNASFAKITGWIHRVEEQRTAYGWYQADSSGSKLSPTLPVVRGGSRAGAAAETQRARLKFLSDAIVSLDFDLVAFTNPLS